MWQAPRQRSCRGICQISEWLENSNPKYSGFETCGKTSVGLMNGSPAFFKFHMVKAFLFQCFDVFYLFVESFNMLWQSLILTTCRCSVMFVCAVCISVCVCLQLSVCVYLCLFCTDDVWNVYCERGQRYGLPCLRLNGQCRHIRSFLMSYQRLREFLYHFVNQVVMCVEQHISWFLSNSSIVISTIYDWIAYGIKFKIYGIGIILNKFVEKKSEQYLIELECAVWWIETFAYLVIEIYSYHGANDDFHV